MIYTRFFFFHNITRLIHGLLHLYRICTQNTSTIQIFTLISIPLSPIRLTSIASDMGDAIINNQYVGDRIMLAIQDEYE